MGFHDVAFLPSRARFSITFHKNCCRGESHETTTCLRIVKTVLNHLWKKLYLDRNLLEIGT